MRALIIMFSLDISGGNNILLNHLLQSSASGVDVVVTCPPGRFPSSRPTWHQAFSDPFIKFEPFEDAEAQNFDVVIPTYFETFFLVDRIKFDRVVYFVQSIESRFFGQNLFDCERADLTYSLPVGFITVADWISRYLNDVFGHKSTTVRNGLNKNLFHPNGPAYANPNGRLRVLVEGASGSPFKRVRETIEYAKAVPGIEVWWLTPHDHVPLPGVDVHLARVSQKDVPEIYRACDLIIKLSSVEGMFGPPLEMFHCGGTAITSDVTGHDEYMVDGVNGIVIPQRKLSQTKDALRILQDSPSLMEYLKINALQTAAEWPSAEHTGIAFWSAVRIEAARCPADKMEVARYLDAIRRFCRTYLLAPRRLDEDTVDRHREALNSISKYSRAVSDGIQDLAAIRLEEARNALKHFGIDVDDRIGLTRLVFAPPESFSRLAFSKRVAEFCYLRAMAFLNFDNEPAHAEGWFMHIWRAYLEFARRNPGAKPDNSLLAPQALKHAVIARERFDGASGALRGLTEEIDLIEPALLRRLADWDQFWQALHDTANFLLPGGDLSNSERAKLRQLAQISSDFTPKSPEHPDLVFLALRGALQHIDGEQRNAVRTELAPPIEPAREQRVPNDVGVPAYRDLASRALSRIRREIDKRL